jgi:predicted RNase H-like HicB family nuclease
MVSGAAPAAHRQNVRQAARTRLLFGAEAFMHNEFTAIIERDGDWYVAYCAEIPGANGQGRSKDEARASLAGAIALILEDRREDALRGVPADATRETVVVE